MKYKVYVSLYFVFLVFIGSFFFVNMTLAIMKQKFTETQKKIIDNKTKGEPIDFKELKELKHEYRVHYKKKKFERANSKLERNNTLRLKFSFEEERIPNRNHSANKKKILIEKKKNIKNMKYNNKLNKIFSNFLI